MGKVIADTPVVLHNSFMLTFKELQASVPVISFIDVRQAKMFLSLSHNMLQMEPHYLWLVDKNNRLNSSYKPAKIREIESKDFLINKPGMMLDTQAWQALKAMLKAASKAGLNIPVISAWRSYEYQTNLVKQAQGNPDTLALIAEPGTSQHQLGTAVDLLKLDNTPSIEGKWLWENAPTFGWSLSYPKDRKSITGYDWESWHWRWIGRDAVRMQQLFFDNSQAKLLEFWQKYASVLSSYHRIEGY